MLYKNELVITDKNYSSLVGDGQVLVVNGERRLLSRLPRPASSTVSFRPASAAFKKIPRSEWSDRLKDQIAKKARISDRQKFPPHDQNGLPTCWANGPAHALTTLRVLQGLPYVEISACSVAVPISGGHRGGWEGDALEYYAKHGGVSCALWPNNDTNRSLMDKPEVQTDRLHHKALEWFDLGNDFDNYATACLLQYPIAVAYNWWSHVVSISDLVEVSPNRFGLRIRNNWGKWGAANDHGFYGYQVLEEGRGTPSSGFCVCSITPSMK